MTRPPLLSVVVPCFNEVDVLGETCRRLTEACKPYGQDYEILFVNDGSGDGTWQSIEAMANADTRVVGVNLSRNHGHQLALTAGLAIAQGQRLLIIDADLQDPPELLPQMMALMDAGYEVVYGVRQLRTGETWFKLKTASVFYRLLNRLSEVDIPADTGDFRLMSRRAVDFLLSMPERHRFLRGMVTWIGLRQAPFPYERQRRYAGRSKYSVTKMVRFAFDAITGFSVKPLKIAIYLSALSGVMALVCVGYTIWSYLARSTVAGWTSLMVVVLLLGSANLFVLGIIGEYLGQIFLESKRRPLFIIDGIYRGGEAVAPPPDHAD